MADPPRSLSQLQAALEDEPVEDLESMNLDAPTGMLNEQQDDKPRIQEQGSSSSGSNAKGKGKVTALETIYLDDSDEELGDSDIQRAIAESIQSSQATPRARPSASSSSKRTASNVPDADSSSDLEILSFPTPSTSSRPPKNHPSTSTPTLSASSSNRHKDKKPRLRRSLSSSSSSSSPEPSSSSTSTTASIRAFESSINSLLTSYSLRRITRPEYISKKLGLREEAKALGIFDFEHRYGSKFDQVEREMMAGSSSSNSNGSVGGGGLGSFKNRFGVKSEGEGSTSRKDSKGKRKAGIEPHQNSSEGGTVDRRLTSAQVRAKEGGGGSGNRKGPRPNVEILARSRREWDKAKIVPLTIATAGKALGGGGGSGINQEAMERAKRRALDRDAKRRREMKKKGIKGGIDGWIEGGLAGPVAPQQPGVMPGGWGSAKKEKKDEDSSDSSASSDDSDVDYSDPDDDRRILARLVNLARKGRKSSARQTPTVTAASQELAAFHRRQQNANLRSTKAVDEAVAALGMQDKNDSIPGMKTKLLDFQWIGLAFMAKREMDRKVPGGVLADEMGLGKTVQTIALIMARRSHDPEIRTNLIVVPLSLLSQWEDEIERFAIGQSVHIYHGSNKYKSKSKDELSKFDVVLTTHSTLALEWPKSKKKKKKKDDEEEAEEEEEKKEPGLLFQFCFYRVIVDEAHVARNPSSRISKAISKLDAVFRWALTGTPMINSLRDYYSLHRFLRNRPWREYGYYQKAITSIEKKQPVEAGRLADSAIGPLTLRRRKTDQLGGKVLVDLPPKSENQVVLRFDEVEREIYDQIEAGYQTKVNKFFRAGTLLKNFHFILVLILRLKQLSVHPHLMAEKVGAYNRSEELERAKKVLGDAVVKRIQQQRLEVAVKRAGVDDFEDPEYEDDGTCPVCEEPILTNPGEGSVTPCGHVCCTTCIQEILHTPADEDGDLRGKKCKKGEAPCPMCRAPFSEKTLFDLECFEPDPKEVEAAVGQDEEGSEDESGRDVKPRIADKKGKGKAKAPSSSARIIELSDDDDDELPDPSAFFDVKPRIKPEKGDVKPKLDSLSQFKKEQEKDIKPRFGSPSGRDIKPMPSTSSTSASKVKKEKKERPVEHDEAQKEEAELQMSPLVPSSKMIYILKKLRQFQAEDDQKLRDIKSGAYKPKKDEPEPDTRTIILSQFVGALDLLDRYLTENGILSVRFQGSTSADERREAIRLLGRKDGVKVMLLSTKAGGVGLNLTAACRVLSLDLAWSKAVEAQAFDRTFRLGQRRPVEIERIIVADTIEERILNLQARKTLLSDMSLAEGQGDPDYVGNISVPDILSLFRLDKNGNREGTGGAGGGRPTPGGRGGRGGF